MVDGQLAIWRGRCPGLQYGEWRAAPSGLFIATVSSWSGGLEEGGTPPPWLSAATAIAIAEYGRGAQLMGSHGQFLAELVRVYDGFDGELLVLIDPNGLEIGHLASA